MAMQFAFGKIVTDGLVLIADPNDINSYPGSGLTWRDMSGNNNNGTLNNGILFESGSIKSFYLDGTNDNINFGAGSSLNITNNVSLDIWFKLGNNYGVVGSNWGGIISKRGQFDNIVTFGINQNGTGDIFQVYFNTGVGFRILSVSLSQYFSSNTWTNTAATFAQSSGNTIISLYKNGNLITSSSALVGNVPASSANLLIGVSYGTSEITNMNCGSVKIYNKVLSAAEILQNYNTQKSRFNL